MTGAVAVLGCGSIGLRHVRNLAALRASPILVYDPDPERAAAARAEGARAHASTDSVLEEGPVAVVVCSPTVRHAADALDALRAGAHVFIEKPIATDLAAADEVIGTARRLARTVTVGYNLRFHSGLRAAKDLLDRGEIGRLLLVRAEFGYYLPDWRRGTDYRASYSARSELGGGIVFDASHELDYVRWLAGEITSVSAVTATLGELEIDVEDTALAILRLASGALAEIHLDCLQRTYSRGCRLIGTAGTITWDFATGVRIETPHRSDHLPLVPDTNEMYREELDHFLRSIDEDRTPAVSAEDARRVLEVSLAMHRSARSRREVTLEGGRPS